jgi:hypothetical protein
MSQTKSPLKPKEVCSSGPNNQQAVYPQFMIISRSQLHINSESGDITKILDSRYTQS